MVTFKFDLDGDNPVEIADIMVHLSLTFTFVQWIIIRIYWFLNLAFYALTVWLSISRMFYFFTYLIKFDCNLCV